MNIAAITKYKHGSIYKLLQKLGWSQSELARRCDVCSTVIGDVINMVRRPNQKLADTIQRVFGEAGEYLDVLEEWPDSFRLEKGFKREEMADIPVGNLLYSKEVLALEFESTAAPKEMVEGLEAAMKDLTPRERTALDGWIDGESLEATGKRIKVTPERCRQIGMKAMRKLRHPSRIALLDCDEADRVIEEEREAAARFKKEKEERDAQYLKEALEKQEKMRYNQEKLDAAKERNPDVFNDIKFLSYFPGTSFNHVVARDGWKKIVSGPIGVLKFIRDNIDPEWPEDRELSFDVYPQ